MVSREEHAEIQLAELPEWWVGEERLEELPEPRRAFAARILGNLFAEDERPRDGDDYQRLVERHGADPAWQALEVVREALTEAEEESAPADALRSCRRRLVNEARSLARSVAAAEVQLHHDLLRDVSHDIRSPLNSVLFLVEGLYREHSGPLNATQRRQVGVVYSAAAALLNLVNDLLDFSKLLKDDAGVVADVPFGLASVISNARHLVGPVASHHDATLEFEIRGPRARRGDPQLLTRLLINFVSNGIEAAGEGGRLDVRFLDGEDGELCVRIDDDGPGGDVERVQELLDGPEDRRWSRSLQGSTHGLGLLISGELVRRAGGDTRVERRDGGGTRIEVTLPFPPVEESD